MFPVGTFAPRSKNTREQKVPESYLHTHIFICNLNEPYLPLNPQDVSSCTNRVNSACTLMTYTYLHQCRLMEKQTWTTTATTKIMIHRNLYPAFYLHPAKAGLTSHTCIYQRFCMCSLHNILQTIIVSDPQAAEGIGPGGPRPAHFLVFVGRSYTWPAHF